MVLLQVTKQITEETMLGLSPRVFIEIIAGIVIAVSAIFAFIYNAKKKSEEQDDILSRHTESEEKHNQSILAMIHDAVTKFSAETRQLTKEYKESNELALMQTKEELLKIQSHFELQHKAVEKDICNMNNLNELRFKAIEKEQDRGYKENVESNKQLLIKINEGNMIFNDVATKLSEHLSFHKGVEFASESKCKLSESRTPARKRKENC